MKKEVAYIGYKKKKKIINLRFERKIKIKT
jgi:hypothetical protein